MCAESWCLLRANCPSAAALSYSGICDGEEKNWNKSLVLLEMREQHTYNRAERVRDNSPDWPFTELSSTG
jgi:hypothetical protein